MENEKLVKFLLGDITDKEVKGWINHIDFPKHIGTHWHKVMSEEDLEKEFGVYKSGVDLPRIKDYEDMLKEEPYNCKDYKGSKYVFFVNNDMGKGRMFI